MRTYKELKQQLIQIKDNDYNISNNVEVDGLITDMLKFIGHTDAELRDELIYLTFSTLVDNKTLSTAQIKHILTICLDEQHLFFGIGEKDTDSVFTRAFSSLPISVALWFNQNEAPFLAAKEILDIKNIVMRYISQEKDCRGYVDGKGWAHAIAHIADVLGHLAESSKTVDDDDEFSVGRDGLLEILNAVKMMICNKDCVYTAEEDERLAVPVMDVIYREILTTDEFIGWVDSFNMTDTEWKRSSFPDSYRQYVNCKNFMRSLYFKLLSDGDYEEICKSILDFLVESED
jgi:hypothetical protein